MSKKARTLIFALGLLLVVGVAVGIKMLAASRYGGPAVTDHSSSSPTKKRLLPPGATPGAERDPGKRIRAQSTTPASGVPTPGELFHFDAEGFDRAWNHILKNARTDQDRVLHLRQVVIRMATIGHPEEAIKAIQRDFGAGKSRENLVEACFANITDPKQLKGCFELLTSDSERNIAVASIFECIAADMSFKKGAADIRGYDLAFLKEKSNDILLKAAEQYFTQVTAESSQTGEEALQSILSMGFDDTAKLNLLARLSDDLPFESWAQFSKIATSGDSKNDSFRRRIIDEMVRLDPAKTIAELMRSGQPKDLEVAIRAWGKADQSKPLEWLKEHQDELAPGQASQAFAGLSRFLAEAGRFSEAASFLGQISDPKQKQQLEGTVWSLERDALRSEVARHPSETLESLMSGKSKFQDYWIEEAMHSWVSKDFDKAVAWYEANWKSMPSSKSQFVAAAFATHSIGEKDVDAARQWAALISDSKTRARIDAAIAKSAR